MVSDSAAGEEHEVQVAKLVSHIRLIGALAIGSIALTVLSLLIWFASEKPPGPGQVISVLTIALTVLTLRNLGRSLKKLSGIRAATHDDV